MPRFAFRRLIALSLAPILLVACGDDDDNEGPIGPPPGGDFNPEIVDARATWVEEGWEGRDPIGTPGVQLFWSLPEDWRDEVFRVYGRRSGSGDYLLIATVTSCRERQCVYTDTNVATGQSYDYFIVAVDERRNVELGESTAVTVQVPSVDPPAVPDGLRAIPLDGGAFLLWDGVGAAKYRVFLTSVDDEEQLVEVGATDGLGYVDTRAENGAVHSYAVAGVGHPDQGGYVGRMSESVTVVPRPDYHADVIYAQQDSVLASGFRFRGSEDESPILAGTSGEAQWRLEATADGLVIVPLGATEVTEGIFTTDLSCGPGSEGDCVYVAQAPGEAAFGDDAVLVSAGNSYVFRLTADGQTHYAKIRVQGDAADGEGRRLLVFDWAFQLLPGETSLNVQPLVR